MNELFIKQMLLGELENFSYIIGDKAANEAMVIDPAVSYFDIQQELKEEGLALKGVLLTHGHYDHVVNVDQYDVAVYLSVAEALFYIPKARNLVRTQDGQKLPLGGFHIECLHTPGHTPGCQSFLVNGNLFTGDTLFLDAVGRTDFPGGSSKVLFQSLKRIKGLPDDTVVWPGHHYGSGSHEVLRILKQHNPFLMCEDLKEFSAYLG